MTLIFGLLQWNVDQSSYQQWVKIKVGKEVQVFDGDGYKPCKKCGGTGQQGMWSCMHCGGEGKMTPEAKEHLATLREAESIALSNANKSMRNVIDVMEENNESMGNLGSAIDKFSKKVADIEHLINSEPV